MQHIYPISVSFGDCDPAGIVFYPNTFRWMDATFHDFLRGHGGHAVICDQLNAKGLGLVDSSAQFRSPMRDGDLLSIQMTIAEWGRKTVTVTYEGQIEDRVAFSGKEVRCVFIPTPNGLVAGDMSALQSILRAD